MEALFANPWVMYPAAMLLGAIVGVIALGAYLVKSYTDAWH